MQRVNALIAATCLALTAGSFFGCEDALPTGSDGTVIMPLKVGNRWIAQETTYDENGDVVGTALDTLMITSMVNKGGEAEYRTNTGAVYTNRPDGLYALGDCEELQARYPAQTSDTFNTLAPVPVLLPGSTDPIDQIIASKVIAVSEEVHVPAGSFRAYHYAPVLVSPVDASFTEEIHSYYVPDLGPVRMEHYMGGKEDGYLAKVWELKEVIAN